MAGGRRAGQILDGVMKLGEVGFSQFADIVEMLFSTGSLLVRDSRFPQCKNQANRQTERDQSGRRYSGGVSCQKLAAAINKSVGAGNDGQTIKMAPNVFRELLNRGIAPLRLLAQSHQHDVVEVTG